MYGGYAVIAAAIVVRATRSGASYVWGGSVVVISMLLLSPMSSKSHFIVLLLPYMAAVAHLIRHREGRSIAVPLLIASFALNTMTAKAIIGRGMSDYLLSWGGITAGTLLLLSAVAVLVFQSHKETTGDLHDTQPDLRSTYAPTNHGYR